MSREQWWVLGGGHGQTPASFGLLAHPCQAEQGSTPAATRPTWRVLDALHAICAVVAEPALVALAVPYVALPMACGHGAGEAMGRGINRVLPVSAYASAQAFGFAQGAAGNM